MVTQNPGAGGQNPQAQGLREIEEDASDLLILLQGFIDHAGGEQAMLAKALVEYHRRALQSDETIDQLGAENQRQVGEFNALRGVLAEERHRLMLERLSAEQKEAFIRLLQQRNGGIVLQTGEPPMNKSCRGLPLEAITIAVALGTAVGILLDFLGPLTWFDAVVGMPTVFGATIACAFIVACALAHKASESMWWNEYMKPGDKFAWLVCKLTGNAQPAVPAPPPRIAELRAEAIALGLGPTGLTTKRNELADLRARIEAKTIELLNLDRLIRTKAETVAALMAVVPRVQADVDVHQNDLITLTANAVTVRNQLEADRLALADPAGLVIQVAELESQIASKNDEAQSLEDDHNEKVAAPKSHYFAKWTALVFGLVIISVACLWDVINVNKIIGQSRVAEKRDPGIFTSGGTTLANPMEGRIVGIPELKIGSKGAITAVRLPDGRIMVFLGAGDISPEAREKIVLSEYSAPSPSGN